MAGLDTFWQLAGWSDGITHRPIVRTILERPICLYRTDGGDVVALDDRCPHRFAPLHLGQRNGDGIACPYHGLVFDRTGMCVHNPHGSQAIPALAKVGSYRVEERQGAVWLWLADEDPAGGPPDHWQREAGSALRTVTGYLPVDAHFSLVIDNLLDLTHAGYLHPNTVSVAASARQPEIASGVDDGIIYSRFITRDVPPPGPLRAHSGLDRADYHRLVQWHAPSVVRTLIGVAPCGRPLDEGIYYDGYHILTAKEAMTTHYFWSASRNFALDDDEYDDLLCAAVANAFGCEDEPMIAACQRYMGTADLFSLQPALLETDRASVLVHRKLKQLAIVN